jgi:cell division protein FtsI (penicillin-binding protein 3)
MMNKSPRQTMTAPIRRMRFVWVAVFFFGWTSVIGLRLGWLQVFHHQHYVDTALKQQQRTFEVAPRRGVLYDRNLRELAMTVLVDSVYAVPSELAENKGNAAELLAEIVHSDARDNYTSKHQMLARFNASRNFAWVARRLDADTSTRVRELNLKGVYFQKEFKRFYPNNDLAAQVLGYVGMDDLGLGGLERQFEDDMHGVAGHMVIGVDAKRQALTSIESQPMPGENLVLSIDANIQYMAERALDAQMAKVKALHGTVVVQDPHTGNILALAISPRFNPNELHHSDASVLENLAVSDVYEPGSTFKLVAYSAAIDAAGVQPTDLVDCQNGAMTMYGRTLHDDRSDHFGVVSVQYALEHSSDVGAAKMALKLGNQRFYDYIRAFGFGERTGIELPSETRGLLRAPKKWDATSILSLAIGQEIGVTPVQLVTMVSTIANGGVYMPPHVLLASTDQMKGDPRLTPVAFHPSNQLPSPLPDGSRRVIKEMTSAKMRMMMQAIVTEGTGSKARLNGYTSAGKTGTANKVDVVTHAYSHTKLVASFAGFAPVSNPAISVAVVIDTPTAGGEVAHYGGAVSAPVFADVAQQVLEYLGVPHDQPLKTKKELLVTTKKELMDGAPSEHTESLDSLFSEVNNLPADDPLRAPANAAAATEAATAATVEAKAANLVTVTSVGSKPGKGVKGKDAKAKTSSVTDLLPAKVVEAFKVKDGVGDTPPAVPAKTLPAPLVRPASAGSVMIASGNRVAVPEFVGAGLRFVVERAGAVGLRVQPVGSGLAREQYPAAGTMVPAGTEVVVRFTR